VYGFITGLRSVIAAAALIQSSLSPAMGLRLVSN
jgi:hypothetical protein